MIYGIFIMVFGVITHLTTNFEKRGEAIALAGTLLMTFGAIIEWAY